MLNSSLWYNEQAFILMYVLTWCVLGDNRFFCWYFGCWSHTVMNSSMELWDCTGETTLVYFLFDMNRTWLGFFCYDWWQTHTNAYIIYNRFTRKLLNIYFDWFQNQNWWHEISIATFSTDNRYTFVSPTDAKFITDAADSMSVSYRTVMPAEPDMGLNWKLIQVWAVYNH